MSGRSLAVFVACVAFLSPQRSPESVGTYRSQFVVYRDATIEHCFREVVRIGRTWIEDEVQFRTEVPFENCAQ